MESTTHDDAIRELAAAIPRQQLPPGVDHATIVNSTLSRERELSTDLGNGVAIPHARCENLKSPLAVVGRSAEGIVFSSAAPEPVHLLFLLITPAERPELQITLLGQLAGTIRDRSVRDRLRAASSPVEVMEILEAPAR
jgi:mannitol/fructose-specific phosphotransferase system IIA component (Ntr-type)